MKKLFFFLFVSVAMAVHLHAQSDAITKYFDKYMNDDRFSMVYISPSMFKMLANVELEGDDVDQDVLSIVKDLKGLRILSYDGAGGKEFFKEANAKVDVNHYEELLVARDGDENVRIVVNSNGDIVNDMLLLVGSDDSFVMVNFSGNIDLKKVGKLGKVLNMEGLEHLRKLDEEENAKDGDK